MGWTLNDSAPVSTSAGSAADKAEKLEKVAVKSKKRAAADIDADTETEGLQAIEKPVKKARGRGRPRKHTVEAEDVDGENGPTNDLSGGVKEEGVDDI
jgi:hypothetical protein